MNVIIKPHNRVIFRHIFRINMNVSSILVMSVIVKLQHRLLFRDILSLFMKI